jgi:hypothetical protein
MSSATDPVEIQRRLPTAEEEYKRAEGLTEMFDTTRRAGAGGTKAGSVGLRPSGGQAANAFLDNYTGTGRHKPRKTVGEEPIHLETLSSKVPEKRRQLQVPPPTVILPPNFCPDCDKTDIVADRLAIDVTMLGPGQQDACSSLGILPFDIIVCCFCRPCFMKAYSVGEKVQRKQEQELAQPIMLDNGRIVHETPGETYLRKRSARVAKNMIEYMRIERLKGNSPIFRGNKEFQGRTD